MDRPGGHGPSDARSIRAGDTVTVAEMEMQRFVIPPYAGSNPVSHLLEGKKKTAAHRSSGYRYFAGVRFLLETETERENLM